MRKRLVRILGLILGTAVMASMVPVVPALAAGTLSYLQPSSGPPGQVVYVYGSAGFVNGETVTIYFDASAVGYGYGASGGTFTGTFTVPATATRGNHNVTVIGSSSGTSNALTFVVAAQLTLSATSGYVGDQISVSGSGFTPNYAVYVQFDSTTLFTTTASSLGSFTGTLTIPATYRGSHTVSAYDYYTGTAATTAYFSVLSKLTVSPTSVTSGGQVTITGTGYGASQGVTLYLDETSLATTTTDGNGNFTASNLRLPATQAGDHTIRAQDTSGNSQSVTFSTLRQISLSASSGTVGSQVNITGTGFRANDTITFTLDNTAISSPSVTSDGTGNFACTVQIPAISGGAHQLQASDSSGSDSEAFTVQASGSIQPSNGYVGTKITVNGSGFLANRAITVSFDNTPVAQVNSNESGSFATSFTAPAKQAGAYKVRASDGTNTAEMSFTVTTSASITETSVNNQGYVGAPVTVSGVGFNAGATVTVTFDGKQIATGKVGSDGKFSITFNAPVCKGGDHTVTVSDGTIAMPLVYVMDSTPPPAPALIQPVAGANQKALGVFQWSAVSDPSGVTYSLQVASSPDFSASSLLVNKTGLTTTSYTLTSAEKLKATKKGEADYWRVMAIDNASNASGWSNVNSFLVPSVFPAWGMWTLIGLGAVIIVLFAFWLGRRSGTARPSTRLDE